MSDHLIAGRRVRGLTLKRPWPWAFEFAGKRVENRKWAPPRALVGGWLALHAGKGWDAPSVPLFVNGEFGPAAARVLDDIHPDSRIFALARIASFYERDDGPMRGPWAFGPFVWELTDFTVLPIPVDCRGAQGLWRLSGDVFEQVRVQLERVT